MRLDQELASFSPEGESVLTIGVFDGVHRGHRHLISQLTKRAKRSGRLAGVVTFPDHPDSVLRPDFTPHYLTCFDDRICLLKRIGVDFVVPVTFDEELSRLKAGRFVQLLQTYLSMRSLVVGPDFAMGHRREGNVSMLTSLGRRWGFSVYVVEPLVDDEGQVIRSTAVREALSRGEVARVATQMGRNFSLSGTVVRGKGRGMPLGFPTVNLQTMDGMAMPGDGTYAVIAHTGGQHFMATTNIGTRPTFGDGERTVEAFMLDFDGDLYGRQVRLEFVQRLRNEVKFHTVEALKQQVARDVERAREILSSAVIVSET